MKRLIIALGFAALFAACASDNSKEDASKDIPATFAPIINGTWVSTGYITDLAKTKSPVASAGKLDGIAAMIIDPSTATGDTLLVTISVNNHEGSVFYAFYRRGQDDRSLPTDIIEEGTENFYELGYNIANVDTTLVINHYNKEKKLLDSRSFSKVTGPLTDESEPYGVTYMANKVLFSGKYAVTDDEGKTINIELTDDGMVRGMDNHTTYTIFTDVLGDPQSNLDEMAFDPQTKTQKPYIFEISADTIRLFKAMENDERTLLIRGHLKYTMVRQ